MLNTYEKASVPHPRRGWGTPRDFRYFTTATGGGRYAWETRPYPRLQSYAYRCYTDHPESMSNAFIMLAVSDLNTPGFALHCALLLLLVLLSGIFSSSETALFSLTRIQLEKHGHSGNPFSRLVPALMARPKQTLMIILVGNTAVNVLLFAVSYVFFQSLARQYGAWITPVAGIGSVLLVVVGGEVIPKVLAVTFADRLAPFSAMIVKTTGTVAGPLGRVIDVLLAEPFTRLVLGGKGRRSTVGHELSTVELKAMLHMSQRHGEIDWLEDRFLREIIDLGSTRVREIMAPRVEVVAYDINKPAEGLRELIRSTRLKKIPVFNESIDQIVGLVYAKMLFLNPDQTLEDVLVPVHFVPELATCEALLRHFRQTKSQLAIVVDEYGGTAGLVTLEDVLEEIVGEISDPEDEPSEREIKPLSDTEYDISGRLDVRYWVEMFGLPAQTERVATVSGLMTAKLGRPARVGDVVRFRNVELRVTSVHRWRIERLYLRLLSAEGESR